MKSEDNCSEEVSAHGSSVPFTNDFNAAYGPQYTYFSLPKYPCHSLYEEHVGINLDQFQVSPDLSASTHFHLGVSTPVHAFSINAYSGFKERKTKSRTVLNSRYKNFNLSNFIPKMRFNQWNYGYSGFHPYLMERNCKPTQDYVEYKHSWVNERRSQPNFFDDFRSQALSLNQTWKISNRYPGEYKRDISLRRDLRHKPASQKRGPVIRFTEMRDRYNEECSLRRLSLNLITLGRRPWRETLWDVGNGTGMTTSFIFISIIIVLSQQLHNC